MFISFIHPLLSLFDCTADMKKRKVKEQKEAVMFCFLGFFDCTVLHVGS